MAGSDHEVDILVNWTKKDARKIGNGKMNWCLQATTARDRERFANQFPRSPISTDLHKRTIEPLLSSDCTLPTTDHTMFRNNPWNFSFAVFGRTCIWGGGDNRWVTVNVFFSTGENHPTFFSKCQSTQRQRSGQSLWWDKLVKTRENLSAMSDQKRRIPKVLGANRYHQFTKCALGFGRPNEDT